jgi:hypothetical protein
MARRLIACSPLLLLPFLGSAAAPAPAPALQLSAASNPDGTLTVTFRNTGHAPCILNLGLNLGNGQSFRPTALSLLITPTAGPARELRYKGFFVGGTVDDFLVPLPPGATYSLPLALADFISETNGIPSTPQHPPLPGESLQARLAPAPASHTHDPIETLWKTPITSNAIPVPTAKP